MASINEVTLTGNLGQDPKLHEFDNGDKVVNLSVAVNEYYKDKDGEKQKITHWVPVVSRLGAENHARFLRSGSKVAIAGKLRNRKRTLDDGTEISVIEVVARHIEYLDSPSNKSDGPDEESARETETEVEF